MLSKIVVNLYTVLLEIGLWLILIAGLIGGWQAGGFLGAIGGLISSAIFGAVFFGAFLVLNDIRARVKVIEERQQT
jgi:ABC-type multidrug transport system permease subunit